MEIYNDFERLIEIGSPTEIKTYLDKEYLTFRNQNPGKELDFLWYIEESIKTIWVINLHAHSRKKIIFDWNEEKRKELKAEVEEPGAQVEKIKWKGSPAIFTFLFRELVEKGYIEPPIFGAEWTYSGLAKLCLEHFDIDVDPEYFARAMRNPDALVNTKREKFTIPDLSDLV